MNKYLLVVICVGLVWLFWGFFHFGPFYLEAIRKEAFALGHEGLARQGRLLVVVPETPVSWIRIFLTCVLAGPFALKAMKKLYDMEHHNFDDDGNKG